MIAPDTGESPDEDVFYCLFCEKVTTFRNENYDRFEGHMKNVHMVVTNLDTATKVNFLKKEKKNIIVDQAKAVAKKGETFFCGLCSDSSEFELGETKTFKSHMEVAHNIFFEIGKKGGPTITNMSAHIQLHGSGIAKASVLHKRFLYT